MIIEILNTYNLTNRLNRRLTEVLDDGATDASTLILNMVTLGRYRSRFSTGETVFFGRANHPIMIAKDLILTQIDKY